MRLILIPSAINISNTFFYTMPFLVILSILVFIHEFGHYIVAKLCGIKIEEFSIGFGKSIASFKDKSGTIWKFAMLPFGGYVKMFGDQSPASAPDDKKLIAINDDEKKMAFFYKKPWQKLLVVSAGPIMNFILAIIFIAGLFYFNGYATTSNVISFIEKNSPAEKAGLIAGDRILTIDKKNINDMNDIKSYIMLNVGKNVTITYKRNEKIEKTNAKPDTIIVSDSSGKKISLGKLGIGSTSKVITKLNINQALIFATKEVYNLTINTIKALKQIITGQRSYKELGGPLHIANTIGETAKIGIIPLIWLTAAISANLGLINMLPIPVLDGGHFIYYTWELVSDKTVSPKYQIISFKIGMYFIAIIFLLITFNDIKHFIYKIFL